MQGVQQMPGQNFGNQQQGFIQQQPPPLVMQQGQNMPFQPRMMQNTPQQHQPPLQTYPQIQQQPPPRTNFPPFTNPQQGFLSGPNLASDKSLPPPILGSALNVPPTEKAVSHLSRLPLIIYEGTL